MSKLLDRIVFRVCKIPFCHRRMYRSSNTYTHICFWKFYFKIHKFWGSGKPLRIFFNRLPTVMYYRDFLLTMRLFLHPMTIFSTLTFWHYIKFWYILTLYEFTLIIIFSFCLLAFGTWIYTVVSPVLDRLLLDLVFRETSKTAKKGKTFRSLGI